MAKHCTNCGHELRDSDKFCAECGTAVGGVAPLSQPTRWEYCEIRFEILDRPMFLFDGTMRFWADAIGLQGKYVAGKSSKWKDGRDYADKDAPWIKQACDDFIRQLTSEGWEPLPDMGEYWYSYKFRRPVKG